MPLSYSFTNLLAARAGGASVSLTLPIRLALHTSAPGTSGPNNGEVTGGSYSRSPITFGSASGGVASNTSEVTFSSMPAATVTYVSFWDSTSVSVISASGTIGTPVYTTAGWKVAITGMSTTTGLSVGSTITATNGTGSFASSNSYRIQVCEILSSTSVRVLVTGFGTQPVAGSITNISSAPSYLGYSSITSTAVTAGRSVRFNAGNIVFGLAGEAAVESGSGANKLVDHFLRGVTFTPGTLRANSTSSVTTTSAGTVASSPANVTGTPRYALNNDRVLQGSLIANSSDMQITIATTITSFQWNIWASDGTSRLGYADYGGSGRTLTAGTVSDYPAGFFTMRFSAI